MEKRQNNQEKPITREQAENRILHNLPKLTDREMRMADAFIQGLKKDRG